MDREIKISLRVDSKGAVTSIEQVGDATVNLRSTAEEEGPRMGRVMEEALGSMIAGAAERAMQALQNLVRRGFQFVTQGVEDANFQAVVDERLRQALVRAGEDGEEAFDRLYDAAGQLQAVTNFGNEAAQAAQAMLLSFGVGSEGAERLTTTMADLAAGVSASSGQTMDLTQSARLLGLAMEGNTQMLGRYGIRLNEQEQAAIAAASGMERVELVAALIEERFGGMAEATADPFKIMENAMGDLRKELGGELLPAARDLAGVITEFISDDYVKEGARRLGESLANGLRQGVDLLQTTIRFLIDYRGEIALGVRVVGSLTAAVVAYRVATQAQALATRAATIAQRGLNVAIRANPIGLIVSALTLVMPLIWRFRGQIAEAGAVFLDFGANIIRGVRDIIDWFARLVEGLPDWARQNRYLKSFQAGIQGVVGAADRQAKALESGAEKLRGYSTDLRDTTSVLKENTEVEEENKNAKNDNADATDDNTDATEDHTAALEDNLEAQKPLPGSLAAISAELQTLKERYDQATTEEARAEALAHIEALEAERDAIEAASRAAAGLDRSPAAGSLDAITDRIRELQAELSAAGTQEARDEIFARIQALQAEADAIDQVTRARAGLDADPAAGSIAAINAELSRLQGMFDEVNTQEARDEIYAKIRALEAERDAIDEVTTAEDRRKAAMERQREAVEQSIEAQLAAVDTSIQSAADVANATINEVRRVVQAELARSIAKSIASIPWPANLVVGAAAAASINALFNRLVPAFAQGGLVPPGEQLIRVNDGRGRLAGQEMVMNAPAVRDNYPILAAMNAGAAVRPTFSSPSSTERVVEEVPYFTETRIEGTDLVIMVRRAGRDLDQMMGRRAEA